MKLFKSQLNAIDRKVRFYAKDWDKLNYKVR